MHVKDCETLIQNVISTCENLLGSLVLRIFVWLSGIGSIAANLFVVFHRLSNFTKSLSFANDNILILNLTLADILAGVYLLLLSALDLIYRGQFILKADEWKKSFLCKMMAVISTLSACMSLFVVALLAFTRCLHIVYSFKIKTLHITNILVSAWLLIIAISSVPLSNIPYFGSGSFLQSDTCLLFNFSFGRTQGWEYSFTFFTMLNLLLFCVISAFYIRIMKHIVETKDNLASFDNVENEKATKVSQGALKLLLLLLSSNLLVWLPLLTLSFLAYANVSIPHSVSR